MQGILSQANSSISGIYGCIGYNVQDLITREFAPSFFKYITMASELATRNVRRTLGANTGNEIAKRKKPELIIQPTFAPMDENAFMQNIPLTTNWHNLQYRTDHNYLFEAIRDRETGYSLKFRPNRDKIDYDVTINLDTLDQQINVFKVMQNRFTWGITQAFEIALESVIPKRIIALISKLYGMDLDDHEEYIPIILRLLNQHSAYPITYKIRNASSTDEWFLYYSHRVYITFMDLQMDGGSKKNMSEDKYPITFRVNSEFNLPAMYFLEATRAIPQDIEVTLESTTYGSDESDMFPMFTIPNIYSKFPQMKDGMMLYGTSIFKTDEVKYAIEDRVQFRDVLDNDHIRVIRSHIKWNMPTETLMKIYIVKNRVDQVEGTDYWIDWNTLEVVIKNPDRTATYRIAIYFNFEEVNEILSNDKYERAYDIPEIIPTPIPEPEEDVPEEDPEPESDPTPEDTSPSIEEIVKSSTESYIEETTPKKKKFSSSV